jgi:hypothetical protein
MPGGAFPGGTLPSTELPMPNPSDLIRPPAVPIPAPGDVGNGVLPYPAVPGVPVRGVPIK